VCLPASALVIAPVVAYADPSRTVAAVTVPPEASTSLAVVLPARACDADPAAFEIGAELAAHYRRDSAGNCAAATTGPPVHALGARVSRDDRGRVAAEGGRLAPGPRVAVRPRWQPARAYPSDRPATGRLHLLPRRRRGPPRTSSQPPSPTTSSTRASRRTSPGAAGQRGAAARPASAEGAPGGSLSAPPRPGGGRLP
jgi:hypothetical protein